MFIFLTERHFRKWWQKLMTSLLLLQQFNRHFYRAFLKIKVLILMIDVFA